MVRVWYVCGTCVVRVWYVCGTCVVRAWYVCGTCVVLLTVDNSCGLWGLMFRTVEQYQSYTRLMEELVHLFYLKPF